MRGVGYFTIGMIVIITTTIISAITATQNAIVHATGTFASTAIAMAATTAKSVINATR